MSIRIITHAYAEKLPQFAVHLRVQLSSLLEFKPRVPVIVTVCHAATDWEVIRVLDDLQPKLRKQLDPYVMEPGALFRRSIGRNIVSLASREDIIWFADVDYFFGPGCLDTLAQTPIETAMVWPRVVKIHKDHAMGDAFWQKNVGATGPLMPDLYHNDAPFIPVTYSRAIGGIQIVRGEFARKHGYLNGNAKYQRPRTDGKPFADFQDDVAYRKFCCLNGGIGNGGGLRSIELPNVYRMRHTATTYQG